jgi:hypothetical protein
VGGGPAAMRMLLWTRVILQTPTYQIPAWFRNGDWLRAETAKLGMVQFARKEGDRSSLPRSGPSGASHKLYLSPSFPLSPWSEPCPKLSRNDALWQGACPRF